MAAVGEVSVWSFGFLRALRCLAMEEAVGFAWLWVFLQRSTITFLSSEICCLSIMFSCSKLKFGDWMVGVCRRVSVLGQGELLWARARLVARLLSADEEEAVCFIFNF